MGTDDRDREVTGRPAHRRPSSRRGAQVGLVISVAVLAVVTATVAVGATDPDVGVRPQFGATAGEVSPDSDRVRLGSVEPRLNDDGGGLTLTVRPAGPTSADDLSKPVRLVVPSVGIDASVDPTGVSPDGATVIPKDAYRVGWYKFGPPPGSSEGSAVIVGHVDSRTQGRGALYPLREVRVGDRVTVGLDTGEEVVYRVVSRESISKKGLPVAELFSRDGAARLTLITCGGAYVKALGGYQDNVVVTALPVKGDGGTP